MAGTSREAGAAEGVAVVAGPFETGVGRAETGDGIATAAYSDHVEYFERLRQYACPVEREKKTRERTSDSTFNRFASRSSTATPVPAAAPPAET